VERLKLKLDKGHKVAKTEHAARAEHRSHFSASTSPTNESCPGGHDEGSNQLRPQWIKANSDNERSKVAYDEVIEQHTTTKQCQHK
jgi:hypothetical protein